MAAGKTIHVNDKMQSGYSYALEAPVGADFAPGFEPHFTP